MMARGAESLNGFVDSGCTIRGELEFSSYFRVDGRIEGTVRSRSELVVGEGGVVEGEVEVARCIVGGEVRGTIRAAEQVLLHAGAKVWADIHTPALVMEDGAFLEGSVTMDSQEVKKNTNKAPSAS
ncbi:MAG: polymer-forming cytoskeletal protein [Acidobacteria bacterium]|uniref:Polymer-forming cytoskeletal protein n=1 Tax=Candidatus Sulfomarinibacter kjeldsenii TaxID=2885994 RepID=A0A8J6YBW5_9BACT|nr:polymer-forming cytoskeletal protein [Candidatus Sulfomarinibacter kjeldsenii]MBD3871000.1 polymer-forming cytoskeletal protein [Candidatus Sulfomarinibacter kjeldsenii]